MARKALVVKAQRKPKFSTRKYSRCNNCGRPHSVYRKFGLCRICFREMALKDLSLVLKRRVGRRKICQ